MCVENDALKEEELVMKQASDEKNGNKSPKQNSTPVLDLPKTFLIEGAARRYTPTFSNVFNITSQCCNILVTLSITSLLLELLSHERFLSLTRDDAVRIRNWVGRIETLK